MGLLKLKAKVLLLTEEQMEVEGKYDLGDIAKSKDWVWRSIAVPVEEVYRITEYNKSKTIVQLYDEEKIFVAEPFEEVFLKWEELKKTDWETDPEEEEIDEEENKGTEENEE